MWHDELRKMKAASGLTTKDISLKSNVPEPTLEKIFSGQTKEPKLPTIMQIVHCLGFTLDDLAPKSEKEAPASPQGLSDDEPDLMTFYDNAWCKKRLILGIFLITHYHAFSFLGCQKVARRFQ